ncbi:two-component system, sensor histidine kinase and response regulator [Gammaproteobacteria bacterium]
MSSMSASLRNFHSGIWPSIVVGIGLTLTIFEWNNTREKTTQALQSEFEFRSNEIHVRVKERLKNYEQVLLGVSGLFSASKSVERDEFREYVTALHLGKNYPGIQGVGFSLLIPALKLSSHIETMRQEGFIDYNIRPAGERDPWTSIIYLEPFKDRNLRAFGYDMYSESVRRAAMDLAWNTGKTTISGKVILLQETNKDIQAGFLMYVPLYRNHLPHMTPAERRDNLVGWAYAPFRMNDLMQGILGDHYGEVGQVLGMRIYDGKSLSAASLMLDSDTARVDSGLQNSAAVFQAVHSIEIANHYWTLVVHSLPDFELRLSNDNTRYTLIVGLSETLVLTIVAWLLVTGRTRALRIAEKLTHELSETEARYHQTFEINSAIKLIVDSESGRIIDANRAVVKYYGYDRQQLLSLHITDINCLTKEEIRQEMLAAAEKQRMYFLFRHRLASGEIRNVEVYSGPIVVNERIYLYSIIHDITERKLMEENLRRLTIAVEQVPAAVVITNIDADVEWVNRKFSEVTGYTQDEIIGKNPRILQSGKHDAEFYQEFWNTLISGQTWQGQLQNRRKNGDLYWEEASISPVRDGQGNITSYVGVKQDITERKQAEIKLSNLIEEQKAILQSEVVGIVMLRNRLMVWMNKAYVHMLGYNQPDELINQPTRIFYPNAEVYLAFEQQAYVIINAGQVFRTQIEYRRKDGSLGWFDISGTQLRADSTESIWAFVDISMQKRTERELIEATKSAEHAARLKSEFLANMSHEIRTPMNGIIGLSELALYQPLTSEVRDYLRKIHDSSKSLLGILNDILDYSKIESGRMTIENAPFDLDVLADILHNLFSPRANEKALRFTIEMAPEVPRQLIGDSLRLQQVLSNLLGNAIKFTEHGQVLLRITAQAMEHSQARLLFCVEDNGIGMSEETVMRLFQPFSQADGSISRRFGGTGLGLAISRELLLLMGSDFTVESSLGKGSAFSFHLPFAVMIGMRIDTRDRIRSAQASLDNRVRRLAGARILVAEDNTINQQVIQGLLQHWGLVVKIADHGQKALDCLVNERFDVVLMDVHMPEMDGLEATRWIRQGKTGTAALPVIALTAGVTPEEREQVLASGMNGFIGKPINQEELADMLLHWIPERFEITTVASTIHPPPLPAPSLTSNTNHTEINGFEINGFDFSNLCGIFTSRAEILGILEQFSDSVREDLNEIDRALAAEKIKQASLITHRLKGAAGNIGAIDLHRAAEKLDAELRCGKYTVSSLEALREMHDHALAEIARCVEPASSLTDTTGNPETLAKLTEQLQFLMTEMDLIPDELLTEFEKALPTDRKSLYKIFKHHINQFDYKQARVTLEKLCISSFD